MKAHCKWLLNFIMCIVQHFIKNIHKVVPSPWLSIFRTFSPSQRETTTTGSHAHLSLPHLLALFVSLSSQRCHPGHAI